MRNNDGHIPWCIYADGHEKTKVEKIVFNSVDNYEYTEDYVIEGLVTWTFGNKVTHWDLNQDSGLKNYLGFNY